MVNGELLSASSPAADNPGQRPQHSLGGRPYRWTGSGSHVKASGVEVAPDAVEGRVALHEVVPGGGRRLVHRRLHLHENLRLCSKHERPTTKTRTAVAAAAAAAALSGRAREPPSTSLTEQGNRDSIRAGVTNG